MNEIIEKENIISMIYKIRGKYVVFDFKLAEIFDVSLNDIDNIIKSNNINFSERYCFKLSNKEIKKKRRNYIGNPMVFTKQGIIYLALLLKSNIDDTLVMKILDAFEYLENTDKRLTILEKRFKPFYNFINFSKVIK